MYGEAKRRDCSFASTFFEPMKLDCPDSILRRSILARISRDSPVNSDRLKSKSSTSEPPRAADRQGLFTVRAPNLGGGGTNYTAMKGHSSVEAYRDIVSVMLLEIWKISI